MAESKVAICNFALGYVGASRQISSLTESSQEAVNCNLHYDQARKELLKEMTWPFATRYRILGMVEQDPTVEWGYSYRYPSNCLRVRRILTGTRNDPEPPPFVIGSDDDGLLIYCDIEDAQIEYTVDEEDPLRFDALFADALAWKIGYKIAPSLGRMKGATERCDKMYLVSLSIAKAESANETQRTESPDAEAIRARQ